MIFLCNFVANKKVMKKFFTILGMLGIVSVANAQNLVPNPSFESGLAPWAAGWNTSYTAPSIDNTDAYAGSNSAKYDNPSATTGFFQDIPVTAGTQYTVSFWYKSSAANKARIWSNFKDASGNNIYLGGTSQSAVGDPLRNNNSYLAAASAWTQFSLTFTAPTDVTTLTLHVRAYGGGVVSFDEFSLTTGTLAVGEVKPSKYTLVQNTYVKSEINFGADAKDVKIYSMYGQVVREVSVKNSQTVNVSDLPKGTYIVTGTVNNNPVSQKILKD